MQDGLSGQTPQTRVIDSPQPFKNRRQAITWAENDAVSFSQGERAHIVDSAGRVLWSLESDTYEIEIPPNAFADMRGNTSIHNHPEERSFSIDDILTGLSADEFQSRVVSEKHRYLMQYPEKAIDQNSLENDFWTTWQKYANRMLDRMRSHSLGAVEAESEALHATWEEVAARHGLQYRREAR